MEDERRHHPRARMMARVRCDPARRPDLVDGSANFLVGQSDNDPFDLPPVAEADYIALVAAMLGTSSRLEPGVVAIGFEQQRRVSQ